MIHKCKKHSYQLNLQLCLPAQRSEKEVYPLKSTVTINIYQNTKIPVVGVEYQLIEKLENGLIDSQRQSQCYIDTNRMKARRQDAKT